MNCTSAVLGTRRLTCEPTWRPGLCNTLCGKESEQLSAVLLTASHGTLPKAGPGAPKSAGAELCEDVILPANRVGHAAVVQSDTCCGKDGMQGDLLLGHPMQRMTRSEQLGAGRLCAFHPLHAGCVSMAWQLALQLLFFF